MRLKTFCMATAALVMVLAAVPAMAGGMRYAVDADGVQLRCRAGFDEFKGRVSGIRTQYYHKSEFSVITVACEVSYPKGRARCECDDVRTSPSKDGDFDQGKQYDVTPGGVFRFNSQDIDAQSACDMVLKEGARFKVLK